MFFLLFLRQRPTCKGWSFSCITKNSTVIPWCICPNVYVISCIHMLDHESRPCQVTTRTCVHVNYPDFCVNYHQLSLVIAIAMFSHCPGKHINPGVWNSENSCWTMITVSCVGLYDIENQIMLYCNRERMCGHICIKSNNCWSGHLVLGSRGN